MLASSLKTIIVKYTPIPETTKRAFAKTKSPQVRRTREETLDQMTGMKYANWVTACWMT